jgi:hypothetical protein
MASILYYGVSSVKYVNSSVPKHHHFIREFLVHEVRDDGTVAPGQLWQREEILAKIIGPKTPLYTLVWNYNEGKWNQGAPIETEKEGGMTYLRTAKDGVVTNNLKHLPIHPF